MLVVKRLHEVPLEQAVSVLYQNDQALRYDRERHIRRFTARFGREGLSPVLSVLALFHGYPCGVVLCGIREMGGEKVAWISDNIVLPKYGEQRVREAMMDAIMTAFEEEGVTLATLEIDAESEDVIEFYNGLNFEVVDRLLLLQGESHQHIQDDPNPGSPLFHVEKSAAQEARFFNDIRIVPWKNQWQNLRIDGELLTILDENEQRVGHIIYKKIYDKGHSLTNVTAFQWRIEEEHPEAESIFAIGFRNLMTLTQKKVPIYALLLASDWQMIERIESYGFSKVNEQVFMIRRF
ncbi:MAG: GNAT family N-acetyltransferase [Tuberibacillus sp.]